MRAYRLSTGPSLPSKADSSVGDIFDLELFAK